jgi:hypothetical protein
VDKGSIPIPIFMAVHPSMGGCMSIKLWFITNGVQVLSVFEEKETAETELNKYVDDPDFDYYSHYSISLKEIEDYPEEYDLAYSNGLID